MTTVRPPPTPTTTPFDLHPRLAFVPFGPRDDRTVAGGAWYDQLALAQCDALATSDTFQSTNFGYPLYSVAVDVCRGDFVTAADELGKLDPDKYKYVPATPPDTPDNCGQFRLYQVVKGLVKLWQDHPGFAPVFVPAEPSTNVPC